MQQLPHLSLCLTHSHPTHTALSGSKYPKRALVGIQRVSKYNESKKNVVRIFMAVLRLPSVETDVTLMMNVPSFVDADSASGKTLVEVTVTAPPRHTAMLRRALHTAPLTLASALRWRVTVTAEPCDSLPTRTVWRQPSSTRCTHSALRTGHCSASSVGWRCFKNFVVVHSLAKSYSSVQCYGC